MENGVRGAQCNLVDLLYVALATHSTRTISPVILSWWQKTYRKDTQNTLYSDFKGSLKRK